MAKPTIRNIVCDECHGKCSAPYARMDGKQFCSRKCYDDFRLRNGGPPMEGHHDYRKEVAGKPIDDYPSNGRDEFSDEGC